MNWNSLTSERARFMLEAITSVLREDLFLTIGETISLTEPSQPDRRAAVLVQPRRGPPALVVSFETCLTRLPGARRDLPDWLYPLLLPDVDCRGSCDYVLFREVRETLFVLLIELKGANVSHASDQLANTRLLVDWLLDIAAYRSTGAFSAQSRGPARLYRGVIFKEGMHNPRGVGNGFTYAPYRRMSDFSIVTLPYSRFNLQTFWTGQFT